MLKVLKLLLSITICEIVGITGSVFTIQAIPTWYITLQKPSFSPPNWLFGPVWTLLYFLMGISIYLILTSKAKNKKQAVNVFALQLVLNFLWTPVFFGLRNPLLGLIIIIALWLSIILTIKQFLKIKRWAGYLLIPYLAWVSFATVLNLSIYLLNK